MARDPLDGRGDAVAFPVWGSGRLARRQLRAERVHEVLSARGHGGLLAEMGAYEERGARDMEKLAAEPKVAADDWHALVRHLASWPPGHGRAAGR